MSEGINIFLVGDLVLDDPDVDQLFDDVRPVLRSADLLIGHVEIPHTLRGTQAVSASPAPPVSPSNLDALGRAGFHVATLAGNHIYDRGPEGIEDTIGALRRQGILTTGAGMNLADATEPAVVEREGIRIGVLSFNCVGSSESWASTGKPGCAFVRVLTHYELNYANPGGPPEVFTFATAESLDAMNSCIRNLKARVDIVIVALHKGMVHTPSVVLAYERQVARSAIDAGADIVVGHHAHILQGMETYKGKPIFHGLGNFVTVTPALNIDGNRSVEAKAWALRRRKLFQFTPDPEYPKYPFHPEAKNAVIATCRVSAAGVVEAGFLPCWIKPSAAPEVLGDDPRGRSVAEYVDEIGATAGLSTKFRWSGSKVLFS